MARWTMNHPPAPVPLSPEVLAKRRAKAHARYLLGLGPNSRADVLTRMAAKETAKVGYAVVAVMAADGTVTYRKV